MHRCPVSSKYTAIGLRSLSHLEEWLTRPQLCTQHIVYLGIPNLEIIPHRSSRRSEKFSTKSRKTTGPPGMDISYTHGGIEGYILSPLTVDLEPIFSLKIYNHDFDTKVFQCSLNLGFSSDASSSNLQLDVIVVVTVVYTLKELNRQLGY